MSTDYPALFFAVVVGCYLSVKLRQLLGTRWP
jgi:hypothetical protein